MIAMKQLFCSEDNLDRKVFFRCLVYFLDFLIVSASRNEAERGELEALRSDFEAVIEEFFSADYFDEPSHVISLLFTGNPQTQDMFDPDKCLIGYCLKKDIKMLFNNSTIVYIMNNVFKFYPNRRKTTGDACIYYPTYHRFSPRIVYILELACKTALLLLIGAVSIEYGSSYGSHFSSTIGTWTSLEVTLAVVLSLVVMHEAGEVVDLDWDIVGYFTRSWNIFDILSTALGLVWLIARIESNNLALIRVSLAVQAIPEGIGFLRYLSINQALGELVMMVRAMMSELVSFIVIYLVTLFGFSICLRGLFYGEADYSSNSTTALSVFSIAFGNFDFSFSSSNHAVNVLGTILIVVIIVLSSVLLLNLLIAQMTNSYQQVKDRSFREWAFSYATIVRQCLLSNDMNVMTMLPAPLNLIPIMFFIPHYLVIYWTPVNDESTRCISLAGTAINYLFAIFYSPLYHLNVFGVMLRKFAKSEVKGYNIILRVAIRFFIVLLSPVFYWVMWLYGSLMDLFYSCKNSGWNHLFFDFMEINSYDKKITWQHVSKRMVHLYNSDVDDINTIDQIQMYYSLPQDESNDRSHAEYDLFEPLARILHSEASKSYMREPSGSVSTEMTSMRVEKKKFESIDESMKTEFNSLDQKETDRLKSTKYLQFIKDQLTMLFSNDDKVNNILEQIRVEHQSSHEKLRIEFETMNEKVALLESKLDLVLTLLQQSRSSS